MGYINCNFIPVVAIWMLTVSPCSTRALVIFRRAKLYLTFSSGSSLFFMRCNWKYLTDCLKFWYIFKLFEDLKTRLLYFFTSHWYRIHLMLCFYKLIIQLIRHWTQLQKCWHNGKNTEACSFTHGVSYDMPNSQLKPKYNIQSNNFKIQ